MEVLIWLTLVGLLSVVTVAGSKNTTLEELFDRLFNTSSYNPGVRPTANDDRITHVDLSVYVQSLSGVNEINMEYTADVYFRQRWEDPRLKFDDFDHAVSLGHHWYHRLWRPDPYFVNSKTEEAHDVSVPNVLMKLFPNGTIFFSQRFHLKLACNMDLRRFPMDRQHCYMKIMSYGLTTEEIKFDWMYDRDPVTLDQEVELAEFDVENISFGNCTAAYSISSHTCIYTKFKLHRRIQFYLVQTYIPTFLIVVLSWVNFWIDPRAAPARVSLSLLCVLTMTTQSSAASAQLPRLSYIKSLDVWLFTCLIFVFGAFLEYAIVNVQWRKADNLAKKDFTTIKELLAPWTPPGLNIQSEPPSMDKENGKQSDANSKMLQSPEEHETKYRKMFMTAEKVDNYSRVIFPATFLLFNILYWFVYKLYPNEPSL
ncbi:glycine receptor subunit alpha-2-like isoform X2 [Liolophura sinensis]|uniref:glycine receptor subunit alpha-2-like isoform X2 n=1 Tax=Liolophura sinensis TaxID=3198878 RepID=UPI003159050A